MKRNLFQNGFAASKRQRVNPQVLGKRKAETQFARAHPPAVILGKRKLEQDQARVTRPRVQDNDSMHNMLVEAYKKIYELEKMIGYLRYQIACAAPVHTGMQKIAVY